MDLWFQQHDFFITVEWVFLRQAIENFAVMNGIGGAFKQHVAKRSLQRSLNNQISDYNTMLDLCENEVTSIKFFGICKDSMISVENREIEKWY